MADLVATMVVGPLLSAVKQKASGYLLDQYNVMEGMEEQHKILKRKLPAILDVIADAEEAASQREGVKAWLEEVKRVAYEGNEIFDEFKYEALRREAKKNGQFSELGFDVIKLFPTHNRFVFRQKMGKKLSRVVQDIEVLVTDMNAFGFKDKQQVPASNQWRQIDHVIFDPKKIICRSREQDTKYIVDTLLGQVSNADLTVVPIVGVGGLGKTTLAQLIYSEPEIQKHFELLIWVCVSNSFDVDSLAKKIAEFHPKRIVEEASNKGPLDILQEVLSGHRYLLVLDDVWNREPYKWEKLKARLTHGAKGSVVLTTTRDEGVANLMGTVKAYNLAALEDNFIKEIIETRAFSLHKEEERPAVLVNMVSEIVKRCRGSPLAATALGSVLCTKTTEEEWKAISSRSNICTEESGILPILKLSYNDLPSEMKQCFAFCAVFPKNYKIYVFKLIQLWIAHGFIQDRKEVSPETIGKWIFRELALRSFFVDVKEMKRMGGIYSKRTCKIHDLMHDVALSVIENECALAPEEPSQTEWLTDTARHLLLSCQEPENSLNDSLAKRSPAIQTLLCDTYLYHPLQHLSKYNSLKALKLPIRGRSFPLKSKHLHHLRYLDLSGSGIETLPEDISILYNLQTLDVSGCSELRQLPMQMKYMTALRHLYTHGCRKIRGMPGDLQKLTSLRTLTCFVAGPTSSGYSDVGELQQLNLGGELELHQLENVTQEDAKAANLGKKKELRELTLKWTVGGKEDAGVLEALKPHDGLQAVRIESYGGITPPTWMAMLQNIVEIHLSDCKELQWLFSCDTSFTFPNLKEFNIRNLQCLEGWWEISNEKQGEEIKFPQLQKLSIVGCPKLTALPDQSPLSHGTMARFHKLEAIEGTRRGHIMFPNLEELRIEKCPLLTALPEAPVVGDYSISGSTFPALKVLCLKALDSFHKWEAIEGNQRGHIIFPNLEELRITECPMLKSLPEALFDGDYNMAHSAFPTLKVLCLEALNSFHKWEAIEGTQRGYLIFPNLEELTIERCPVLTALPKAPLDGDNSMAHSAFPALKVLKLNNLRSFERWDAVEGSHGNEIMFPQLEKLSVLGCGKMTASSGQQKVCAKLATKAIAPKLTLLEMQASEEEMFLWVATHMTSLTKLLLWRCETVTTSAAAHSLKQVVDIMGKGNHNDFPLTDMRLFYLKSGVTELCACFVQLQTLYIKDCASLVHWPEKEFQSLVSLRSLIIRDCNELVGYAQAPAEPSTSSESSSQLLPCLKSLQIYDCKSMVEVFKLPASLRKVQIWRCDKLKSIFSRRLQQGQSGSSILQGPSHSEVSSSSAMSRAEHLPIPCLESIDIYMCTSLTGVLVLLPSIKELKVSRCGELRSVESHSGEMPSLLKILHITECRSLSSLLDEPRAYPSLQNLKIVNCPGIKRLPTCLQQRLSSLKFKELDARYGEPSLFKPETWRKAICRG